MGHPYLQRKVVSGASKDHGYRASQCQEQSGRAILMCVDFGAWGERGIQRECSRGVAVSALGVVIFLASTIRSALWQTTLVVLTAQVHAHAVRCTAMTAPCPGLPLELSLLPSPVLPSLSFKSFALLQAVLVALTASSSVVD